jgi:putative ABC transport system ATP-binding protein
VLDKVDYQFDRGQFVVLLGHSGSGKSTLLNLISGIDRPSAGHVSVLGTRITALSERDRTLFRRDHIGFIFQFFNLIPTLTVLENVTLPQELAGRKRRRWSRRPCACSTGWAWPTGATPSPTSSPAASSSASPLPAPCAHDPLLVLADEPTGNLDDETGERVLALLLELTRDAGRTLLMATHNPDIAPRADRVLQLHDGRLVEVVSRSVFSIQ